MLSRDVRHVLWWFLNGLICVDYERWTCSELGMFALTPKRELAVPSFTSCTLYWSARMRVVSLVTAAVDYRGELSCFAKQGPGKGLSFQSSVLSAISD